MGYAARFDEKVLRLLPEIEKEIMNRDDRVLGVSEAIKDNIRQRFHLKVRVDAEHFGCQYMPVSCSRQLVEEEDIKGIVSGILWVMNRHSRTTKYREALTG